MGENDEGDRLVEYLREDPRRHSDETRDEIARTLGLTRAQVDADIERQAENWKGLDADLVYVLGLDLGPALFDDAGQLVTRRQMPPPLI